MHVLNKMQPAIALTKQLSHKVIAATEEIFTTDQLPSDQYSWDDIYALFQIAKMSYNDNVNDYFDNITANAYINIEKNNKDDKHKTQYIENKDTGAQCYIFYYYDVLIVTFRGTNDIKDFFGDLNSDFVEVEFFEQIVKIHKGFHGQYLSIADKLLESYEKYMQSVTSPRIIFTSHSLGAALNCIAALALKEYHPLCIVDVFGFGSPRVGNKDFAKLYNKCVNNSYRIVNHLDAVVHKFSDWNNYYHVDHLILLTDPPKVSGIIENFLEYTGITSIYESLTEHLTYAYEEKIIRHCKPETLAKNKNIGNIEPDEIDDIPEYINFADLS